MRFLSTLAASVIGTLVALGLVVFFFVFFVFALSLSSDQTPTVQPGSVLTVPLDGPIPERKADDPFQEAFGGGASYDLRDLQTAFRKAARDDRIEAVWLRLKGTTAGWGTLSEVRQAVEQAQAQGVPVVASGGAFGMAEKEYFVASAADSVFVGPQSTFEYNGFALVQSFFQDSFDKLGLEPQVIRVGKYKSAAENFVRSDLSAPNREQLSALLSTINDRFVDQVAADRDLTASALRTMASEQPLLAAPAAVDAGLVDDLRHEEGVRASIKALDGVPDASDLSTVSLSEYKRVPATSVGVSYADSGTVDVVYAEGQIVPGDPDENPFAPNQQVLGSTPLVESIEEARTNASTQAVVVRVNSPGGSASASEEMWKAIERTADEKPVVVSMGDVAASGGYYLAAGADSIVANPTTITGSIGVIAVLLNAEDNEFGVTFDAVRTSPYADLFAANEPLSDGDRRLLGGYINQAYDTFLQRVAAGRAMDTSAVHDVAQGRVWSGRDAQEAGLVDSVGTLQDAIAMAGEAAGMGDGPFQTRVLPRPKTFFERLNQQFATQATQLWMSVASTPLERKIWRHKRVLDRVLGRNSKIQTRLPFIPKVE